MRRLSDRLGESGGGQLWFFCPGCQHLHTIQHGEGPGPRWSWNGSADVPTFSPSVLVTLPANPDAADEFKEWRTEQRCHSFVTDGRIQFLTDSTHALAGQTVELGQLPEWCGRDE